MAFGLINVNATYQSMVSKLFVGMIGLTMESYIEEILVKSIKDVDPTNDLRKTFECMRLYQVRMNPSRCAFVVEYRKFWGYMVSHREIEVKPEKLEDIEQMKSPTFHKEVQILNGRLAALNRFLVKFGDKSIPFF